MKFQNFFTMKTVYKLKDKGKDFVEYLGDNTKNVYNKVKNQEHVKSGRQTWNKSDFGEKVNDSLDNLADSTKKS